MVSLLSPSVGDKFTRAGQEQDRSEQDEDEMTGEQACWLWLLQASGCTIGQQDRQAHDGPQVILLHNATHRIVPRVFHAMLCGLVG